MIFDRLKSRQGFTLIELLLFTTIFAMVSIAFVGIFVVVTRVQSREGSSITVNQESQFAIQAIQRYVRQASLIDMTPDTATTTIKLRVASSTSDPTYIYASSSQLFVKETDSGTPQPLTTNRVTLSNVSFIKHTNPNGHDTVDVSFTMSAVASSEQKNFSQTITTSIARVGIATFNSDIIPSGSPIRLGVQPGDISSINNTIFFTSSSVGIGAARLVTTEQLRLDNGGLRFTNPPAKPSCVAAARGTLWVDWPASTSTPDSVQACIWNGTAYAWQTLPSSAWYNSSWLYRQKITIDYTKVSSTLTNFPVYVNLANMQTGFFTNVKSDGSDIRVTQGDAVTEVPREVVSVNTASSTGELYFNATGLSNTTNTIFYIYYGNAAATEPASSSTYGKNSVWDVNYASVWHLPDGTVLNALDSTINGKNGTIATPVATSGIMDGAGSFNGVNDYISTPMPTTAVSSVTLSAWFRTTNFPADRQVMLYNGNGGSNGYGMTINSEGQSTGEIKVLYGGVVWFPTGVTITNTNWHYAVLDIMSDKHPELYLDGIKILTGGVANPNVPTGNLGIGTDFSGMGTPFFQGSIDEARVSNTIRSSSWILTEYNNQSTPASFYAVSAQENKP